MKKALVFALAAATAGLSVFSNAPSANALPVQLNLVIPLLGGRPVVHNRYYREVYRQPYYQNRYYQGRVYRYEGRERDYRHDGYRGRGDRRYEGGIYRR